MVTLRPRKKKEEATPVANRKVDTKKKAAARKKPGGTQRASGNIAKHKDSLIDEQQPTCASSASKPMQDPHDEASSTDDKEATTLLDDFLTTKVPDENKHNDISILHNLIRKNAPDLDPELQGKSTLAFGGFDYETKSKCTGRWSRIGIMVNKTGLSLMVSGMSKDGKTYILENYDKKQIGRKISLGKSCIRFAKLDDLNLDVVEKIIIEASKADVSPIAI